MNAASPVEEPELPHCFFLIVPPLPNYFTVSMVPIYSLLLFGGSLAVDASAGLMSVDGWAEFKAPSSVGVLVKGLRAELDAILAAKIRDPGLELSDSRAAAAVMELLSSDGF